MMVNSDEFYKKTLKGKNESEIVMVILQLKREMNHVKNRLERRSIGEVFPIDQSEADIIRKYRTYIQRANEVLEEVGGKYQPTKAENFAAAFQKNIPFIKQIVFVIGGFYGGFSRYGASFKDGKLYVSCTSDDFNENSWSIVWLGCQNLTDFLSFF